MTVFRRITIIVAVVILLVPVLISNQVFAAQGTVTVVAPADVNPGSINTMEIQIAADSGIVGFELYVKCDSSVIVFDSVKPGDIDGFKITAEKREDGLAYIVGYLNSLNPIAEGKIAAIAFKAIGNVGTATDVTVSGDVYGWTTDNSNPDAPTFKPVLMPAVFNSANVKISIIHTLAMAVNPGGGGTTTPAVGTHNYVDGSIVEVSAVPSPGYKFLQWDGDVADPKSAVTTTSMKSSKTLVANFSSLEDTAPVIDTTPPVLSGIRAINTGKNEAEILWSTDEIADSQVEYWASPGQLTELDTNLVTTHTVNLTGLNPLTIYHYRVLSRDKAGFLSISDEQSFTTLGTPATFTTSKWTTDLKDVSSVKQVVINFTVTNTGDVSGTHEINLMVNGKVTQTRSITLDAGKSQRIELGYETDQSGDYTVKIGDTTLLINIPKPSSLQPIIISAIAFIILLNILSVIFYGRNKRTITGTELPKPSLPGQSDGSDSAMSEKQKENPDSKLQFASYEQTKSYLPHISVNIGKHSLNITAQAVERLKEAISLKTSDSLAAFRIISSAVNPRLVVMELDHFRTGDYIVDAMGKNILFISPDAANLLDGTTIGYQETPSGGEYFVSRKTKPG